MQRLGKWASWSGLAGVIGLLLTSSCSSSDGGGKSYCETLQSRERACGFIGEGRISCVNYLDAPESCETRCIAGASCADVGAIACFTGLTYDSDLSKCYAECIGLESVDCGNGTTLSGFSRCNDSDDCNFNSGNPAEAPDEQGCTRSGYICRTGQQRIDPEKLCDGTKDCSDGSDELPDCEPQLTCEGGFGQVMLRWTQICDGSEDCTDGRDETDCASRRCG